MTKQDISHVLFRTLAIAVALSATALRADEAVEQRTNDQFMVKLTDGSSITCKLKPDAFPFKTSFAEISVPVQKVETLKIDHKVDIVTLALLNGDRLQGKCLVEDIAVVCILGDLKIPLVNIAEIITTLKREPVYEDTPERRNVCINNLRQIDAGKEQWAMANRRSNGDPADVRGVNEYIKGNRTPVCPAGGKYSYRNIGIAPECSVPGHALR